MTIFSTIKKPTLVLDEEKAKRNLELISSKICSQKIRFRPHFKTHQSNEIGQWFREAGIDAITVSSVDMAQYFAENNWKDILIAFPVNILQIEEIKNLSKKIDLGLLFEDPYSVHFVDQQLQNPVKGWIKVDSGAQRCGLEVNQFEQIYLLAEKIKRSKNIQLQGLLTHAGHTYHRKNAFEVDEIYKKSVEDLNNIRDYLNKNGLQNIEISVGDTPSSRLVDNFGLVDELRPGNFLFYDVQQFQAGVCQLEDIAVGLACPIVAIHAEKNEVIVYGGAVHLSKDTHPWMNIEQTFGLVTLPSATGWENKIYGFVRALSQEHGILKFPEGIPEKLRIGSIVVILPAHSCLTVQAMRQYMNLDGKFIETMLT
jgi:D-serine deaminase-like pyridoxal phosphate-dependent protein